MEGGERGPGSSLQISGDGASMLSPPSLSEWTGRDKVKSLQVEYCPTTTQTYSSLHSGEWRLVLDAQLTPKDRGT